MTPNALAWVTLAAWPVVVLAVLAHPLAPPRLATAVAWLVFLPAMFLPAAVSLKLMGVPPLDKHRLAFVSLALVLSLLHRRRLRAHAPASWFPLAVLLWLAAGAVFTAQTNGDGLRYGNTRLPGLVTWDAFSMTTGYVLDLGLPFAVGQLVFRTARDVRDLLRVLTSCALLYAPFALLEVRLSPQFHYWIYGCYQHPFGHSIRGSFYRPLVFMSHGLTVTMFFALALIAALGLHRIRDRLAPAPGVRAWSIAAVLLLCNSWSSILYGIFGFLLERKVRARAGAAVLLMAAALVVAYPGSRATGTLPVRALLDVFAPLNADRAGSLAFRFNNEDMLLRRAAERLPFGWGGFARNRVYAPWGGDLSITDGQWIIVLGISGITGLTGLLALVLVPILRYVIRRRALAPMARALAGTLAIMVAVTAIDLLPNAWGDFLPLLFAGALFSLAGTRAARVAPRRQALAGGPQTAPGRPPSAAPVLASSGQLGTHL